MGYQFGGVIFKLFLISGLVSLGIKYVGPWLAIPATPAIALGMVWLPSIAIALFLLWDSQRQSPQ